MHTSSYFKPDLPYLSIFFWYLCLLSWIGYSNKTLCILGLSAYQFSSWFQAGLKIEQTLLIPPRHTTCGAVLCRQWSCLSWQTDVGFWPASHLLLETGPSSTHGYTPRQKRDKTFVVVPLHLMGFPADVGIRIVLCHTTPPCSTNPGWFFLVIAGAHNIFLCPKSLKHSSTISL